MVRRRLVCGQLWCRLRGRPYVYSETYDQNRIILIHTPKTAGTALSDALYGGRQPWHFSARELQLIKRSAFTNYHKMAFVRNPWARIYSTYHYALRLSQGAPVNPLSFIPSYSSFETFVLDGLSKELVRNHYFFWSYATYCGSNQGITLDHIGRFEDLEREIARLSGAIDREIPLIRLNSNPDQDYQPAYSMAMKTKVRDLYAEDVRTFGYEF